MANWGNVARDIAKTAPLLGNLLPGVGTLAGAAVGGVAAIVASALGVPADPDSVAQALQNDPDAYVKLKTAEMENRVALGQLSISQQQAATAQYAAEAADRDSARKLAASTPTDHTRQIITYAFIVLIGAVIYAVFWGKAESLLKDSVTSLTIGTVLGYLFNELKQILSYWFGSTSTGTQQTQAITSFAVTPGTVTTTPVLPALPAPSAVTNATTVQSDALSPVVSSPSNPDSSSDTDDSGTQIYRGS